MFAWMIVTHIYTTELARAANTLDCGMRISDCGFEEGLKTAWLLASVNPQSEIRIPHFPVCPTVLTGGLRSYYIGTLPKLQGIRP